MFNKQAVAAALNLTQPEIKRELVSVHQVHTLIADEHKFGDNIRGSCCCEGCGRVLPLPRIILHFVVSRHHVGAHL